MGTMPQNAQGAANDSFAWSKAATTLSAVGDVTGGIGGLQLSNYQAAVAAHNAAIMGQNAAAATAAGEYSAEATLERGGQIVGKEKAGYGASNIDVNVGSPKLVEGSTRTVSAMDAAIERFNAAREAYAYKVQGAAETAQAGVEKSAGIGSFLSGISGAGNTILGGAQSTAAKYAGWKLGVSPNDSAPVGP